MDSTEYDTSYCMPCDRTAADTAPRTLDGRDLLRISQCMHARKLARACRSREVDASVGRLL